MTREEEDLAARLRAEAQELKECFARYSFQVMAFTSAGLLAVARFQVDHPWVALSSAVFGLSVLLVARIGTFKYGSVNRLLGYEMHLHRTNDVPPDLRGRRWHPFMREVGWEEAMRAWRIVQASLFERLHVSWRFWPNSVKSDATTHPVGTGASKAVGLWFQPNTLLHDEGVVFYAGSYLRTMLLWLHAFAILCAVPMGVAAHQLWAAGHAEALLAIAASLVYTATVGLRIAMDLARRRILEEGFLSIPSCAIVWQAVVIAHFGARQQAGLRNPPYAGTRSAAPKDPDGSGFEGYSHWLSWEAESLCGNALDIYRWIADSSQATIYGRQVAHARSASPPVAGAPSSAGPMC